MITLNKLKYIYPKSNSDFFLEMNDVSFSPNQVIALIGANGCGKSTFYRLLSGMLPADDMSLNYKGTQYRSLLETPLRIGFHNAFAPLIDSLTVRQNLKLFARLYGVNNIEQSIDYVSQRFNVTELIDRLPPTLSQGQQHRVKLCRSNIHDPDIIFFDEPTTASDIVQIQSILSAISSLCKQGKIVFFSTHHIYEIMELKPRLIGMENGKIAFDKEWEDTFNSQISLTNAMTAIMPSGDVHEHI